MKKHNNDYCAFKITVKAVFDCHDATPESISDAIYEAISNSGKKMPLMDVESIKEIRDVEKTVQSIMDKSNVE